MNPVRKLLLCLAMFPMATVAVGQTAAATGSASASAVTHRCGGVGKEQSEAMKAQAGQHSLFLVFSTTTGAYVADVDVEIRRPGGPRLLQVRCDGPMMLVDLPDKRSLQVTATYAGKAQTRNVALGATSSRLSFVWPAPADAAPGALR